MRLTSNRSIETIRLPGPVRYEEGLTRQRERRLAVEAGTAGSALFLLEHEPVLTLGRNFEPQNLLLSEVALAAQGIAVVKADRGGDVTYHGPGQLVAYPILNLREWKPSIRWYLRSLERVLINQLAEYGLAGERLEGFTGVWVGGAKVAAIGIGVHDWVTYHGIALNVDPDMRHFGLIIPCGIGDKPVTSLRQLLGRTPAMDEVADDFERAFRRYFQHWVPDEAITSSDEPL
jgi:lipoyl(octanoyl) transferase